MEKVQAVIDTYMTDNPIALDIGAALKDMSIAVAAEISTVGMPRYLKPFFIAALSANARILLDSADIEERELAKLLASTISGFSTSRVQGESE